MQRGAINTKLSIALVLAMAGCSVGWLAYNDYFPFRLRSDGIYSCGRKREQRLIEKPRLDLPPPKLMRGYVQVLRVVDGDTLEVAAERGEERVRLIGIDCDEIGQELVDEECAGWQQTLFVFGLLKPNAQVRLEHDADRKDKYGRTLAYAWLPDGRMLEEVILERGYAKTLSIAPNTKHAKKFAALEAQARREKKGKWAD